MNVISQNVLVIYRGNVVYNTLALRDAQPLVEGSFCYVKETEKYYICISDGEDGFEWVDAKLPVIDTNNLLIAATTNARDLLEAVEGQICYVEANGKYYAYLSDGEDGFEWTDLNIPADSDTDTNNLLIAATTNARDLLTGVVGQICYVTATNKYYKYQSDGEAGFEWAEMNLVPVADLYTGSWDDGTNTITVVNGSITTVTPNTP